MSLLRLAFICLVLIAVINCQGAWFPVTSCSKTCGGGGVATYKRTNAAGTGFERTTFNCNPQPCGFGNNAACGTNKAGTKLTLQTDAAAGVVYCGPA
ncbi:unnamed protein product, partial [Mesorhabditis belari]|uniref:Uncharacterized protein n=1 Tax=Mesorhabditis belari TaxID=2138241 RepID=A0AAF3FGL6_9BILA